MGLFDGIKSLFTPTPGKAAEFPSEDYQGYTITPTPSQEGNQFRVCGLITKDDQEHQFFRADLLGNAEECAKETMRKAKITIDQLGEGIFR